MTQGLVNVFGDLFFLLTTHALRVLPVMLVKRQSIALLHRNFTPLLVTDCLDRDALLAIGLLLQVTEHRTCIPATILRVKQSRVRQLNVFTLRVRVLDKKIDDVITRHVRKLRPFFVQLLPHRGVTERLVQVLVQHQSAYLLLGQLVNKLASVCCVVPIGTSCRYVVLHASLTHHEDARVQAVLRVLHKPNV